MDRCVEKGIADRIAVKEITSESLLRKLNEMLSNPMYKENMKFVSQHFKDQKEPPLDRAIWWIEWMLRNPRSVLVNRGQNLNFFQIQSIDVIAVLTVITLAVLYVLIFVLKTLLCCCICCHGKSKVKND